MKEPILIIILFVSFSLGGFVLGSPLLSPADDKNNSNICQTPACLEIASRLLHNMDPSVNPCDDFYQFSCGGFLNATNSSLSQIQRLSITDNEFLNYFETILKMNSSINDSKYLKIAKALYNARYNINYNTLLDSMEPNGGCPVFKGSQWNETAFDYKKTLFKVDNTTQWKNYFFEIGSISYNSYEKIFIEPYSSDLSVEDFIQGFNNTRIMNQYKKTVLLLMIMNGQIFNATYQDIEKMIEFEIELGRERISHDETFDTIEMTLSDLTNNFTFFNWQEYMNYYCGHSVDSSTIVILKNVRFIKKLAYLLKSTDMKTVANFIMWKHIENNLKSVELAVENVQLILKKLPIATGAIYIQHYNHSKLTNAKNNVVKIILNIKENFLELIKEADWIDDKTKNKTTQKLQLIENIIGYIDEFTNNSKIDEFYKNLELSDNEDLFEAIAKIDLFHQKIQLTYNDENMWAFFGFFMINSSPAFVHILNSMIIPFSTLSSDLFDFVQPNYIHYSIFGSIIGHEITHGFDVNGKNYNEKGDFQNFFWTQFSTNNFYNKSKCIIEQYGNYTVPEIGLKLNGNISQSENISDNGGLKAAYRAYKKLSHYDKPLGGLNYTPKQLFWINYANLWCEKTTPEMLKQYLNMNHSPSKFRIIGTLSNIPDFANDFSCPTGSNMNPTNKCSIW